MKLPGFKDQLTYCMRCGYQLIERRVDFYCPNNSCERFGLSTSLVSYEKIEHPTINEFITKIIKRLDKLERRQALIRKQLKSLISSKK